MSNHSIDEFAGMGRQDPWNENVRNRYAFRCFLSFAAAIVLCVGAWYFDIPRQLSEIHWW